MAQALLLKIVFAMNINWKNMCSPWEAFKDKIKWVYYKLVLMYILLFKKSKKGNKCFYSNVLWKSNQNDQC